MSELRYPNVILATACIPWTANLDFDVASFCTEVQSLIDRGVRYIYLFGTAGEGYAVSDRQFGEITSAFAREMSKPDLYPMVGLISLSMSTMTERLQFAYALGIRDFMFALPSWGMLQDDELSCFLHQLCDPYPDCRFVHYNLMRSKRLLSIGEYERYAGELPNLAAVKFSTGDPAIIKGLAESACPLRFFLTEQGFAEGSLQGDFGLLLSVASSRMSQAHRYHQAGLQRDAGTLKTMQQELGRMVQELIHCVGNRIDGGYDKIFCKIMNRDFPLRLLPPYQGATDQAFEQYCRFLSQQLPHWIE
ncbi:MAG TPA: hypothetical protein DD640_10780 [Clostridiales bacterium]|nr:hypothetical protein [Clostridiales bacterium]